MISKYYTKSGQICRATFKLPAEVDAEEAFLVGDFNAWDREADPMKKLKDGSFSLTISLEIGRSYRFRYLLDRARWENDWEADEYQPNAFGSEDSVVRT
jgi:1,4-alpha-glucan branching enzyme